MNLQELTRIYDLSEKTFFVTGGTGVLCGAIARALNGCGANIALLARNEAKGRRFAESTPAGSGWWFGDVLDGISVSRSQQTSQVRQD
jgi:NAD(P)-dependent dehydrogenase (short-subunit alcohol dehydrogenase family)